jgi:hypothetical protein
LPGVLSVIGLVSTPTRQWALTANRYMTKFSPC